MRALVLSGGASKGAFTAGVVQYLLRDKQKSFELAIGTSTGSLVAGPALLNEHQYLESVYTGVQNSDIYQNSLIYWLLNQIVKVGPIDASMEPLSKKLRRYYLRDQKLQAIINAGKKLVVTSVNVRTGIPEYVQSDDVGTLMAEETFVKAIVASCSEPVFTEPVRIYQADINSPKRNDLFYDGGIKEFLPLTHAIDQGADEIWVVSTHPLKKEETSWGSTTAPEKVGIFKALGWTVGSLLDEVERGDLYRAWVYLRLERLRATLQSIASSHGLASSLEAELLSACSDMLPLKRTLPKMYLIAPDLPMATSLEFDPAVMQDYFADGQRAAEKFFADGSPEFVDYGEQYIA